MVVSFGVLALVEESRAEGKANQSLAVFPGAKGFGTTTPAGSGRHQGRVRSTIYRVTSRAESGSGSLRECVEGRGARICVFEVGGRFSLTKPLHIKNPYLTFAGQTAPSPGVVIVGAGLEVDTHDVLIQHMEVRVGDRRRGTPAGERDGIKILSNSARVVIDHLSVSWATDENVSITPRARDVTISNCIISEGLHRSIHPKGAHSKGLFVGDKAKRISVHHSLLAHNHDRNPYLQRGSTVEFVNNVVYNWGGESGSNVLNISDYKKTGDGVTLSLIGNTYKKGQDGPAHPIVYGDPVAPSTRVFALDNIAPREGRYGDNEWRVVDIPESPYRASTPPIESPGAVTENSLVAYENVLLHAGSRSRERNLIDARVVSDVREGAGSIKDCVAGCTRPALGWPRVKNTKRRLRLPRSPLKDWDKDGYTNLEEWLHDKASGVE